MTVPGSFQSNYDFNMPRGIPGRIADCGFKNTLSPRCLENILPALGVMKPQGLDYAIMLPRDDVANVTLNADLVEDNVVNATVNGVAINPVTFVGGDTHIGVMQAVANEIALIPSVSSATVGGANNRSITVVSTVGTASVVTVFTVTGGASQAGVTITGGQSGTFFGVTQEIYNKMNFWTPPTGPNPSITSGGQSPYFAGQVAPTLTQGRIYVVPEDIVTSNSPVYLRVSENAPYLQVGSFRSDADGGNAILIPSTQAVWREGNLSLGDVAVLELNLP